jgi:glutamate:GABA antiporter
LSKQETPPPQTGAAPIAGLHRVLGTFDVVLLNVAAIISFRWLAVAAQVGPSSLTLWALGLLTFFVPSALTVLELNSRLPGEGGMYTWSKMAFGDLHAFVVGWSYWVGNLVFFPSILLFAAGVFLYGHAGWLKLADSVSYNAGFSLAVLWLAIILNIFGLERAKWLQNIGGIATWVTGALVLVGGALAWHKFGSATPFGARSLVPDLGSMATFASFSAMALAYLGLELGPVMGGEIKNARRAISRALLSSCVLITIIYVAGTAALLIALPAGEINLISGIPQALAAVGARVGIGSFGAIAAVSLTVSQIGSLGAWISGTARLPFLFGLDRYLPEALGTVHPRFGSPYVALLTQGALTTLVLLAALSGSAIHEAFIALIDMSMILSFVPLLYMFAALPALRRRADARAADVILIPGGLPACWGVAGAGMATLVLGIVVAMVPPTNTISPWVFGLKVVGGCFVMIAAGLVFYARGRRTAGASRLDRPAEVEGGGRRT